MSTRLNRIAELLTAEAYAKQPEIVVPEHEQKTLMDLGDNECRYACNDGGPFKFCARPREVGFPYCRDHARIAYQLPQPAQRRGAPSPAQTNASAKEEKVHA